MKLDPGYYKIKVKGLRFYNKCHFLRVTIKKDQWGQKKKYFQIDKN